MASLRKYPFSFIFLGLFLLVFISTWMYTRYDIKQTSIFNNRIDSASLTAFQFKDCVNEDSTGCTGRLLKSMMIMKQRKNDALDDATLYYENTFIYAHLLGILSIFGSMLILLVVTQGLEKANNDLKIAIGSVFMVCSTCYFLPKFMNNEVNYKENMNIYYAMSRQLNYSTKNLSYHCCCYSGSNPDSLIIHTADSNFSVIGNNLTQFYDMDFDIATKYFEEFKANQKGSKPAQ